MFYSYQDCWNYAFSTEKINNREQIKRDLISICQISPAEFWWRFTEKSLSRNRYLQICHNFAKYFNENCPIPYLTQKVYFYGLTFYIKKKVFIPQKDTEILVEKTLELADKYWGKEEKLQVLDIGTGCGNIAISLAKFKSEWQFVATDINQKALNLAQKNALIHQTKNIKFCQSDLFTNLNSHPQFDIAIANPPYLNQIEYQKLSSQTKKQPKNALLAKENGYFFYRKIFQWVQTSQPQKFLLLVEIGSQQKEELQKLAQKYFSSASVEIFPDYAGHPRVVAIHKIKHQTY